MALKTTDTKVDTATLAATTVVLELALYKIYTWGNITYEAGKPYRFRNSDALILLGERDLDRPIWKRYAPPKARQAPKNEVIDATNISAPIPVDEFGSPVVLNAPVSKDKKRIDVGTDDEIQDVLNRPDDSGDVTV